MTGGAAAVGAAVALFAEHTAEDAAVERGPRDDAETIRTGGGEHFELGPAEQQVVDRLRAQQAAEVPRPRGLLSLREVPAGEVGRAEAQQGRVDRVADVARGQAAVVRSVAGRREELRGQHGPLTPVAAASEPAAEVLPGAAGLLAVRVGGVEERDAVLVRAVHDGMTVLFGRSRAEVRGPRTSRETMSPCTGDSRPGKRSSTRWRCGPRSAWPSQWTPRTRMSCHCWWRFTRRRRTSSA